MRRLATLTSALLLALAATPLASAQPFPSEIQLPDTLFPEGIAIGRGSSFYVGSLADGSVYKGDLRTGEGAPLTTPAGPFTTVGIEVDNRERVWVAGGPSGTGRVYDGTTGALLASYQFTDPFGSFINDVVVTPHAAYFTDSGTSNDPDPAQFRFAGSPRLFVVPLGPGQTLPPPGAAQELTVGVDDVTFPNLNGIETTPTGALIVGHTTLAALFTVDPATGSATSLDVGQDVPGNDGLIRRGTTLFVVQNSLGQIAAISIAPDGSSGSVDRVYPVEGAVTPTTAGIFGNALYAVDARFGENPPADYRVYRVPIN